MQVLSNNLKRLRLAKKLTQEQAAERLGVSTQTVSRWECNTTLPDVTMLPEIAALYCVTIDDLYREVSMPYDNYAARLLSVFEASHQPDDFIRAEMEYGKLFKSGEYTKEDLRSCGILHQYMMQICRDRAEMFFDQVIQSGPEQEPETYWRTRRQKVYFLWELGRNGETIREFLPLVEAGSTELNEWICLIQAYQLEQAYETAFSWAQKASQRFAECAIVHIYSGDLCRDLKRYEEAFCHWRRALELEPTWCDAAYSIGFCYEELGDYEKAYEVWCGIADDLSRRGYDAETHYPRSLANRCKERLSGT